LVNKESDEEDSTYSTVTSAETLPEEMEIFSITSDIEIIKLTIKNDYI
jgi:hypothetical protein